MFIKPNFEIVDIAGEYMAIPVGDEVQEFKGIAVLSEAAAFLLKHMQSSKSREELIDILLSEYDVDEAVAENDVDGFIRNAMEMGLVME